MDFGIFLCWKSTIKTSQWTRGEWAKRNGRGNRWQQMHKEKHKLAKLSVFFEVRRFSFHRHSEGGNNKKNKTKQTVSQIYNCHFYYCLFMGGPWSGLYSGPWTRSVGGSMDPGSVFLGHPFKSLFVYFPSTCSLSIRWFLSRGQQPY